MKMKHLDQDNLEEGSREENGPRMKSKAFEHLLRRRVRRCVLHIEISQIDFASNLFC